MSHIKRHNYHLVNPSPWPISASSGSFLMTVGAVLCFHFYQKGISILLLGLLIVVLTSFLWWRDVVREGVYEGRHTKVVQKGLKLGVVLFIVSEVMFFVSFFWAFFHSSIAPAIEIGAIWPPVGIEPFRAWDIPLLNTIILVLSGATITWAHYALIIGNFNQATASIYLTITLAIFFTLLQVCEYIEATFNISDGVYGSTFFLATGFHGFHVLIGSIFILVCLIRHLLYHFSRTHHVGFESAAWYWHFVDVVWLILFISIYWWGNMMPSL